MQYYILIKLKKKIPSGLIYSSVTLFIQKITEIVAYFLTHRRRMGLSVEVEDARSGRIIANVDRLQSHATIADVKARIAEKHSKYYVERFVLPLIFVTSAA